MIRGIILEVHKNCTAKLRAPARRHGRKSLLRSKKLNIRLKSVRRCKSCSNKSMTALRLFSIRTNTRNMVDEVGLPLAEAVVTEVFLQDRELIHLCRPPF